MSVIVSLCWLCLAVLIMLLLSSAWSERQDIIAGALVGAVTGAVAGAGSGAALGGAGTTGLAAWPEHTKGRNEMK